MAKGTCSFEGCEREHFARGYCRTHYQQVLTGRPLRPIRIRLQGDEVERFFQCITKGSDGCWEWTAVRTPDGYGLFTNDAKQRTTAHRFAYEWSVGPIPKGLQLDHLCRNRACVNPAHLEPVTQRENLMRGEGFAAKRANATHCERGHEYTPENTGLQKGGRYRFCRICSRESYARMRERKRAAKRRSD